MRGLCRHRGACCCVCVGGSSSSSSGAAQQLMHPNPGNEAVRSAGEMSQHKLPLPLPPGSVQAVQKLADHMASKGCDVLINNAGIFGSHQAEELGPLKGEHDMNALAGMQRLGQVALSS